MNPTWTFSDAEKNGTYVGFIEFQDNKGECHVFEVMKTKDRVVFGGACNIGFLESGYIECEEDDGIDETLQEMLSDLEVYYNDGPNYVSRIVCNERM